MSFWNFVLPRPYTAPRLSAWRRAIAGMLVAVIAIFTIFVAELRATEFLVNTTSQSTQLEPSVATLTGGGFVIAWAGASDPNNFINTIEIRAQRYNASGVKQDTEFQVNTIIINSQSAPSVAALSGGGFVITWVDNSFFPDYPTGTAIRAQRYDASGGAQGVEFLVNSTTTTNHQVQPSAAGLTGGGFIITWRDRSQSPDDPSGDAIRAQRYNASGVAQSTSFLVNTITAGHQGTPGVAALSGGGFVIAWDDQSAGGQGSGTDIRAQRYDASGVKQGAEFLVNSITTSTQNTPSVGALSDGGFVIAWDDRSTHFSTDIRAQRFNAAGAPQGSEFLVNTITTIDQENSSISGFTGGGFVIAWNDNSLSYVDTSSYAVRAQRYDATGGAQGTEFLVNTITEFSQMRPSVAALAGDSFIIAWDDGSRSPDNPENTAIRADIFGLPAPDMYVAAMEVGIFDGDATPSVANDTDFGSELLAGGSNANTFTITNSGSAVLNFTDTPNVTIGDTNPGDFILTSDANTSVAGGGGTTTFTITFDPGTVGLRTATISIANNDSDENPYNFSIQGTGVNTPPTGAVVITGIATQEQTLTADTSSIADADGLGPFSFQWRRNGTPIAGATNATLLLTQADVGSTIDVVVSYTDGGGTNESLTSAATSPVANVDDAPTGEVLITGTATQGQTLTADASAVADVDGLGPFSFQWRRGGADIAGAIASTYELTQADVGSTIDVVVSFTDGGGTVESVTSAPTSIVQAIPQFILSVTTTGPGSGTLSSNPAGIDCGADCEEPYDTGTSVTLSHAAGVDSIFTAWSGNCSGTGACVLTMDQARSVSARFELIAPGPTILFSSVLPSARSGSTGAAPDAPGRSRPQALGDPITVFASVINAGASVAQSCRITIPADSPVTLSYQETDAANAPVGLADEAFDLIPTQLRSFILAFTPVSVSAGVDVFPDVVCDNANVGAIPGVNTVFLSIADKEVPDILSIGATSSGDGIINIPAGGTGFMTISATNIGAGDENGSANATVSVSVDTGAAALPLGLQICETDIASACITPLGSTPVDTIIGSGPNFFAIFLTDQSTNGVALDPANARAFVRFKNQAGTNFSVTSAAVTVPDATADAPIAGVGDLPVGRWAVMVRKTTGIRHAQVPGTLYVWPDGTAKLRSGKKTMALDLFVTNDNTKAGAFTGLEANGTIAGKFTPDHSLFMVDQRKDHRLDIWGVHDTRGVEE